MIITEEKHKIGFEFENTDSYWFKEFVKVECNKIKILIQILGEIKNEI